MGDLSRLRWPQYVTVTIILSAIEMNCRAPVLLTVVETRAVFTSVSTILIIHFLINLFSSDRLQYHIYFLFQTLINHLWFRKSLKEAINAPVVYVDSKNTVKFETEFDKVKHSGCLYGHIKHYTAVASCDFPLLVDPQDVIVALEARGHVHETTKKFYNVVNAVEMEGGCICAQSDARKLGEAAGY